MSNPYVDHGNVRTFSKDVDPEELIWHRDREDRTVRVVQGEGWSFQIDDSIPMDLHEDAEFKIPAMTYHRIIKTGCAKSDLVLRIEKHRK